MPIVTPSNGGIDKPNVKSGSIASSYLDNYRSSRDDSANQKTFKTLAESIESLKQEIKVLNGSAASNGRNVTATDVREMSNSIREFSRSSRQTTNTLASLVRGIENTTVRTARMMASMAGGVAKRVSGTAMNSRFGQQFSDDFSGFGANVKDLMALRMYGGNPAMAYMGSGALRVGSAAAKKAMSFIRRDAQVRHRGGPIVAHGGSLIGGMGRGNGLNRDEHMTILKEGELVLPTHDPGFFDKFTDSIANAMVLRDQNRIKKAGANASVIDTPKADYFEEMRTVLEEVQNQNSAGIFGPKGNKSLITRTLFSAVNIFGARYRAELPRANRLGIMAAGYKVQAQSYVALRSGMDNMTSSLMQIGDILMQGLGVKGKMTRPKEAFFAAATSKFVMDWGKAGAFRKGGKQKPGVAGATGVGGNEEVVKHLKALVALQSGCCSGGSGAGGGAAPSSGGRKPYDWSSWSATGGSLKRMTANQMVKVDGAVKKYGGGARKLLDNSLGKISKKFGYDPKKKGWKNAAISPEAMLAYVSILGGALTGGLSLGGVAGGALTGALAGSSAAQGARAIRGAKHGLRGLDPGAMAGALGPLLGPLGALGGAGVYGASAGLKKWNPRNIFRPQMASGALNRHKSQWWFGGGADKPNDTTMTGPGGGTVRTTGTGMAPNANSASYQAAILRTLQMNNGQEGGGKKESIFKKLFGAKTDAQKSTQKTGMFGLAAMVPLIAMLGMGSKSAGGKGFGRTLIGTAIGGALGGLFGFAVGGLPGAALGVGVGSTVGGYIAGRKASDAKVQKFKKFASNYMNLVKANPIGSVIGGMAGMLFGVLAGPLAPAVLPLSVAGGVWLGAKVEEVGKSEDPEKAIGMFSNIFKITQVMKNNWKGAALGGVAGALLGMAIMPAMPMAFPLAAAAGAFLGAEIENRKSGGDPTEFTGWFGKIFNFATDYTSIALSNPKAAITGVILGALIGGAVGFPAGPLGVASGLYMGALAGSIITPYLLKEHEEYTKGDVDQSFGGMLAGALGGTAIEAIAAYPKEALGIAIFGAILGGSIGAIGTIGLGTVPAALAGAGLALTTFAMFAKTKPKPLKDVDKERLGAIRGTAAYKLLEPKNAYEAQIRDKFAEEAMQYATSTGKDYDETTIYVLQQAERGLIHARKNTSVTTKDTGVFNTEDRARFAVATHQFDDISGDKRQQQHGLLGFLSENAPENTKYEKSANVMLGALRPFATDAINRGGVTAQNGKLVQETESAQYIIAAQQIRKLTDKQNKNVGLIQDVQTTYAETQKSPRSKIDSLIKSIKTYGEANDIPIDRINSTIEPFLQLKKAVWKDPNAQVTIPPLDSVLAFGLTDAQFNAELKNTVDTAHQKALQYRSGATEGSYGNYDAKSSPTFFQDIEGGPSDDLLTSDKIYKGGIYGASSMKEYEGTALGFKAKMSTSGLGKFDPMNTFDNFMAGSTASATTPEASSSSFFDSMPAPMSTAAKLAAAVGKLGLTIGKSMLGGLYDTGSNLFGGLFGSSDSNDSSASLDLTGGGRTGYISNWTNQTPQQSHQGEVNSVLSKVMANRKVYEEIATKMGGTIPWYAIAAIHGREASGNLGQSIKDGSNIGSGNFINDAVKVLKSQALGKVKFSGPGDIPALLSAMESYNGQGYYNRKLDSPYLWSGTQFQDMGKYVADGKFDASVKDKQPGAALLLKLMMMKAGMDVNIPPGTQSGQMGSEPVTAAAGNIIWPPVRGKISSPFGPRQMGDHKGVDISAPIGSPVVSVGDGIANPRSDPGGFGKYVEVKQNDGTTVRYGHVSNMMVAANQPVKAGQKIALSGNEGRSTGPHLHIDFNKDGQFINPAAYGINTTKDSVVGGGTGGSSINPDEYTKGKVRSYNHISSVGPDGKSGWTQGVTRQTNHLGSNRPIATAETIIGSALSQMFGSARANAGAISGQFKNLGSTIGDSANKMATTVINTTRNIVKNVTATAPQSSKNSSGGGSDIDKSDKELITMLQKGYIPGVESV